MGGNGAQHADGFCGSCVQLAGEVSRLMLLPLSVKAVRPCLGCDCLSVARSCSAVHTAKLLLAPGEVGAPGTNPELQCHPSQRRPGCVLPQDGALMGSPEWGFQWAGGGYFTSHCLLLV